MSRVTIFDALRVGAAASFLAVALRLIPSKPTFNTAIVHLTAGIDELAAVFKEDADAE